MGLVGGGMSKMTAIFACLICRALERGGEEEDHLEERNKRLLLTAFD